MAEHRWSQGDLARKGGTDARQISRYENGRITPSVDAVVKIARTFNVSIDYLLVDDAARRPLQVKDRELIDRLQDLESLTKEDRKSLFHILDALVTKNKVKSIVVGGG